MSSIAKPRGPTRAARQKAIPAPAPVSESILDPVVIPPPAEVQPATEPAPKRKRTVKPPVPPPSSPVDIPIAAEPCTTTVCKKKRGPCNECGQKIRKPRAVTNPTDKQLASRAAFKANVDKAKALQQATPGLSYKEAIKRVYGK